MSKKSEVFDEPTPIEAQNEDEFIDQNNLDALREALKPVIKTFPLHVGHKILKLRIMEMDFAHGLEASAGERFKENEVNDPAKTRRIFAKKVNMGLMDGWHIVNDVDRKELLKNTTKEELLARKQICLSIFSPRDWNLLNEMMFPGALDQPETVQNRANELSDAAMYEVSDARNTDPCGV